MNLEIFAIHRSDKGLIFRMCKELVQISNKQWNGKVSKTHG